jgi:dihydropteroate synthase
MQNTAIQIMGILNVTPDSFYDGGLHNNINKAIDKAFEMIEQGATIIDIGGQSTKPNATKITDEEEWARIAPIIQALAKENIPLSIDTYYAYVVAQAYNYCQPIINDISGGSLDKALWPTVANLQLPYILMHIQGTPQTMQAAPIYTNVVNEIIDYFEEKIAALQALSIPIYALDVGFGFGKTIDHNYTLLKNLSAFKKFNIPLLAGLSRKSMIYKLLNTNADNALNGTTALHMAALINGATILRVHDVAEAKQTVTLFNTLHHA